MPSKTEQMTKSISIVAVKDLVPHPKNPRTAPSKARAAELLRSIKAKGIRVPLIVCRYPTTHNNRLDVLLAGDGRLVVLAGHRRLVAAKAAKLKSVPVIVEELDDKEALEFMVAENIEREDLHPLEEAAGYQELLGIGWNLDSIASRFGKTPAIIARRKQLTRLIEPFRKLAQDLDGKFAGVPTGVYERLAALPPIIQKDILERYGADCYEFESVAEFECHVLGKFVMKLSAFPWNLDDETLYPEAGACSKCPKRSSHQPLLWDDEDVGDGKKAKHDRCLDSECFHIKQTRLVQSKVADLRQKYPDLMLLTNRPRPNEDAETVKAFGKVTHAWNLPVAKKSDEGSRPAVFVAGSGLKVRWVKPSADGRAPRAATGRGQTKDAGKPTPLKERRAAIRKRRDAYLVTELRKRLERIKSADADAIIDASEVQLLPNLLLAFGTHRRASGDTWRYPDDAFKIYDEFEKQGNTPDVKAKLLLSVVQVWVTRLLFQSNKHLRAKAAEARRMAELLNVDVEPIIAEAAKKIPEPQSWANLKADGTPKTLKPVAKKKAKAKPATANAAASEVVRTPAPGKIVIEPSADGRLLLVYYRDAGETDKDAVTDQSTATCHTKDAATDAIEQLRKQHGDSVPVDGWKHLKRFQAQVVARYVRQSKQPRGKKRTAKKKAKKAATRKVAKASRLKKVPA